MSATKTYYTTTPRTPVAQTCVTAVPGKNGHVPIDIGACNVYWAYDPSFSAAVAFAVLFGITTVAHLALAILHRKPFCWVIVMGSAWEFSAFITRALGAHDQQSSGIATVSSLLFILAPLWINAFIYMTAGRLIYMLHPEKKIWGVQAMHMGKWFVGLDIVSFLVQGIGGIMLGPGADAKTQETGKNIYMSGVAVQEAFIVLFTAVIVRFHLDVLVEDRQGYLSDILGKATKWWKPLTYTLYAVLALISMRIFFRLAEFSAGADPKSSKLPFIEGYALGLDAFPMFFALFLLVVIHPGMVLKGPASEFPSRKEKKAAKKANKEEKKRIKAAAKAKLGAVLDTPSGHRYASLSSERNMSDVELGQVQRPNVARF